MSKANPKFDVATRQEIIRLAEMALIEDVGSRDLNRAQDCTTLAIVPDNVSAAAMFIARQAGVICGLELCQFVIGEFAPKLTLQQDVSDGARVARGQQIAVLSGDARMILMIERTCLNFLCRLSGISTLTAEYVRRVAGTRAGIFDTRKTTPGWRRIEKYAVTCGGGNNHRMGLYDAIMIKDNHLAMYGNYVRDHRCSPTKAVALARQWVHENQFLLPNGLNTIVQIEVESLSQLRIVLEESGINSCQMQHTIDTPSSSNQRQKSRAAPDIVLLDNMDTEQLRQAVEIRDELNPAVQLEASGGVTLETVESIAQTGVERISVGAITHSARNLDIALDWRLETT